MTKFKDFFIAFFFMLFVFVSFNYLSPIYQTKPVTKKDFTFKTKNITKTNQWAKFEYQGDGTFFVHPGQKRPTVGIFRFKESTGMLLDFWIKEGSKVGDINFTVIKNGRTLKNFNIKAKNHHHTIVPLQIDTIDTLTVAADKNGKTWSDWGQLKITLQNSHIFLENFTASFIWSLFFIFLLGKGYKYLGMTTYGLFLLFLMAEKLNFGPMRFEQVLAYTVSLFALSFAYIFIYQKSHRLKSPKLASLLILSTTLILYALPLAFLVYALTFHHSVDRDALYAVFQSNGTESFDFVRNYIPFKHFVLFLLVTSATAWLLYRQEKKEPKTIENSMLIFLVTLFAAISFTQLPSLRVPSLFLDSFKTYRNELAHFKALARQRAEGKIEFQASKKANGETHIVIIGESLNKRHMGLYGYFRHTTPNLTKLYREGNLTIFSNAYSNHTHTTHVLSQALSQANQYNGLSFYDTPTVVEVLKKAGVETYWLTNQQLYGPYDNIVSLIARSADYLEALDTHVGIGTGTRHYDGELLPSIRRILAKKSTKNRVIFVHLMGNHFNYADRYPHDRFQRFCAKPKKGVVGTKAAAVPELNDYDNSVLYNDYVVSSIIKEAQKHKNVFSVIYMPDHAEDVIHRLGHNSRTFTFEMTQIPLIAWFGEAYKKRYPEKYRNFLKHRDTLFSNDLLYDTLLGIYDIKTDRYDPKFNLSSAAYRLEPQKALTLHRKLHYIDPSNHIYWQKTNAKYLIDTDQSRRIFPHRVDSVGKLTDIWRDGFRAFETDVVYGDRNLDAFTVEHNRGHGDITFEKLLTAISADKIQKIWLDFKNLTPKDARRALARLEKLDAKYHIKDKTIVESGTTSPIFALFREARWHTSYYLPTLKILKLLKSNDEKALQTEAKRIARQIAAQRNAAVSFDRRLFPFVKIYLEPLIPAEIVYHTWYAPALWSTAFRQDLEKSPLYQDKRVKSILAPYDSPFDF